MRWVPDLIGSTCAVKIADEASSRAILCYSKAVDSFFPTVDKGCGSQARLHSGLVSTVASFSFSFVFPSNVSALVSYRIVIAVSS